MYQTKSQSAPLGYHILDQVLITVLKEIVVSKGATTFPYRKKPSMGCAGHIIGVMDWHVKAIKSHR